MKLSYQLQPHVNPILRNDHAQTQAPSLPRSARINPLGNRQKLSSILSSGLWGRAGSDVRATGLRALEQQASWGSAFAAPIFINLALAGIYLPIIGWIAAHDVRMYACSYEYLRGLNPIHFSGSLAVGLAVVGSLFSLFLNRKLRYTVLLE